MPEVWTRNVSVAAVPTAEVDARLDGLWKRDWLLGFRDITGTEKIRTLIAAIITEKGVITPPFAQNIRSNVQHA